MLDWFSRRDDRRRAGDLYGAVVARARAPHLYTAYGVADTIVGRYEMVALHLMLVLDRLGAPDVADEELRRTVIEAFVADMDDAMREIGIGDTSVPRNVKKAAGGLYERSVAYRDGLAADDPGVLVAALVGHVYAGAEEARPSATALAAEVRAIAADLARQPAEALAAGRVTFPDPRSPTAPT
jgi:cytochrome b pre-mRNA-processing protein 3